MRRDDAKFWLFIRDIKELLKKHKVTLTTNRGGRVVVTKDDGKYYTSEVLVGGRMRLTGEKDENPTP